MILMQSQSKLPSNITDQGHFWYIIITHQNTQKKTQYSHTIINKFKINKVNKSIFILESHHHLYHEIIFVFFYISHH